MSAKPHSFGPPTRNSQIFQEGDSPPTHTPLGHRSRPLRKAPHPKPPQTTTKNNNNGLLLDHPCRRRQAAPPARCQGERQDRPRRHFLRRPCFTTSLHRVDGVWRRTEDRRRVAWYAEAVGVISRCGTAGGVIPRCWKPRLTLRQNRGSEFASFASTADTMHTKHAERRAAR